MQTNWRYTDSGPAEPKIFYSTSPGPHLPTDATPRTRSVLGWPSPRRGNPSGFRRTFEAQGLGVHVARRGRTAVPRPRSTPVTSTRRFVSRRHKYRGDPRSRTGLQSGQAIAREGAQRPGIKIYMYVPPCLGLTKSGLSTFVLVLVHPPVLVLQKVGCRLLFFRVPLNRP